VSGIREKSELVMTFVVTFVRTTAALRFDKRSEVLSFAPPFYATVIVALQNEKIEVKSEMRRTETGGSAQFIRFTQEMFRMYILRSVLCPEWSGYLRFIIKVIVAIYCSEILLVRFVQEFFSNNLCTLN